MTPERWRQVKDVLAAALEREPEDRERFLADACGGDDGLRSAVETLIRADARDLIPADPRSDLGDLMDTHRPFPWFAPDGTTRVVGGEPALVPMGVPARSGPTGSCASWGRAAWGASIWPSRKVRTSSAWWR